MLTLGLMYAHGEGDPQNEVEAINWFRKAADLGEAEAMYCLGFMYDNGRGGPQDVQEAVKWYREAAESGMVDAIYNLGVRYDKGDGVIQDNAESYVWYSLAAAHGHDSAHIRRDGVSDRLSAEARLAAQQKASTLFEQISKKSE